MKRFEKRAVLGLKLFRYVNVLEDDPAPEEGPEARAAQFRFLSQVMQQPDITLCGPVTFQKLKMYHNGSAWVIEMEAVVEEP